MRSRGDFFRAYMVSIAFIFVFIALIFLMLFSLGADNQDNEVFLQAPQQCPSSQDSECFISGADNADFKCINLQCVLSVCAPGYCDVDGVVSNGCEIACASQPIAPLSLTGTFAPAATLNPAGTTSVTFNAGVYEFTYTENSNVLAKYQIDINDLNGALVKKGSLRIYDALHGFYPVYDGGAKKMVVSNLLSPLQVAQQSTNTGFSHQQASNNVVKFVIPQTINGVTTTLVYFFEMKGKTLIIRSYEQLPGTSSPANFYRGFTFNCAAQLNNPAAFEMPYLADVPIARTGASGSEVFYSTYVDYTKSGSNGQISRITGNCGANTLQNSYDTLYRSKQPNPSTGIASVPPFEETAYVTVSSDVNDVVLAIHDALTTSRAALNNKVVFDIWWVPGGSQLAGNNLFEQSASLLTLLKGYGLTDLNVLHHLYAQHGRDCGYPDLFPSQTTFGGSTGMSQLAQTAASLGYLFGLDITFDMGHLHPNSIYTPTISSDFALDTLGNSIVAWNNPYCSLYPIGYMLKTDKRIKYAQLELAEGLASGPFSSIFIDVYTGKSLAGSVDYGYVSQYGTTLQQVYKNLKLLINFQKSAYASNGPVSGEGHTDDYSSRNYFSPVAESTEAEIKNGENALVIPDFELRRIKDFQVNQGMGYAGRWVSAGLVNQVTYLHPNDQYTTFYPTGPTGPPVPNINFDKYDATTLAFGHAGFMDMSTFAAGPSVGVAYPTLNEFINFWVQRYYIFRAIQEKYLSSSVDTIEYWDGSGFIDLNQALKINSFDFVNVRLKITYQNDLELYVNRHQTQNWVVNVGNPAVTYYLPSNGWVAIQPSSNFLQYSALVDANAQPSATGTRADYVKSADYIYMDARGISITFAGYNSQSINTNGIVVHKLNGAWQMTEQSDGTFIVTTIPVPAAPSDLGAVLQ